ncbi:ETS-related transcription factor Elf-1-like [Dendronephthya gigantea]|uniref:ETS-related transcription factor Elf-1-like n=1 Tax=Dendronephthya gigantea TaxID=151771 RepID=UPI00106DB64A|nr:ETS-related transcription factor Elf-1-like [Dendronephthya gigantea]
MNGRFWKSTRTTPLLWEFLLSLLQDVECREFIKWIDESAKTFKIVNSYQVATLWGEIKGRPNMDQNKLRRAIRQYYKSGVMKKVKGQKGGYKFGNLPYNPFNSEHQQQQHPNKQQKQQEQEQLTRTSQHNSQYSVQCTTSMQSQARNDLCFDNFNYFLGDSITGENVVSPDCPMDICHSDQYLTDSESEASFESWTDKENIDVSVWAIETTNEKGNLDMLTDKIRLDYFI